MSELTKLYEVLKEEMDIRYEAQYVPIPALNFWYLNHICRALSQAQGNSLPAEAVSALFPYSRDLKKEIDRALELGVKAKMFYWESVRTSRGYRKFLVEGERHGLDRS